MQIYQVLYPAADGPYFGTMNDAHTDARQRNTGSQEIYLWEVDTSKPGVLSILNNQATGWELLRTWRLTSRGGLKEVAPVEPADMGMHRLPMPDAPTEADPAPEEEPILDPKAPAFQSDAGSIAEYRSRHVFKGHDYQTKKEA